MNLFSLKSEITNELNSTIFNENTVTTAAR